LVEQRIRNARVVGSIPISGINSLMLAASIVYHANEMGVNINTRACVNLGKHPVQRIRR
jgi:hypothetical protein